MAVFVSCGDLASSELRLSGSGEPELPALMVPIDRKVTATQQRTRGQLNGLAAFDNRQRDVGCQKAEPRKPDEMTAFDWVG